ncbi:hypothetical protein HDU81_009931 [Chytriomyces hyalinus]|nr:hypothetical protein HDU81_009931 [Chytriomyces hyalinus]
MLMMMEYLSLPPSPDFSKPFDAFQFSSGSYGKECPVLKSAFEESSGSGDGCPETFKPTSSQCPFSIEAALSMHGAAIRAALSKVTPTATSSSSSGRKIEGEKECAAPTNSFSVFSAFADQAPILLKEWASLTQAQISKSLNEISTSGATAVYEASSRMMDVTWDSFPDAWRICKADQTQQQQRSTHCTKAPVGLVGDGVCKPKSHAYTLGRKAAEIREWGRTALKETKSLIESNLPALRTATARTKKANMCVNTASPEFMFRSKKASACKAKKDREWIGLKKVWTQSKEGLKVRGDLVRKGFKNVMEQFQAGWTEGRNHM